MKALGILIILLGVGFVAFQYGYAPVADYFGLEKPKPQVVEVKQPEVVKVEAPKVKTEPVPEPPKPEMPKPEPVMTPPPVADLGASIKKPDADGFLAPDFPPLEQVVKNWSDIPKSAFPRPIKLMKNVEFEGEIGGRKMNSKMTAGGIASAVAQAGENLIVAPAPTSPVRATISIDDTDLKAVLTDVYERWKVDRTAMLKRQFLFAQNSANNAKATSAASPAVATRGDKPVKNAEGTFDVLLASMKAGQVTEITPANIKKWGDAALEKIEDKEYWTVIVDYTTKTMFGDFDTQAQARIFGGKVEKWIYTGSGEVVP
ncbi:MAG TPA: hypothetical protein VK956_00425 [Verrucomicrobium sp.]|nr:hypothetical protein [Verrucomicrobium sp.]